MGKMSELSFEIDNMFDGTEGLSEEELERQMNEGFKNIIKCSFKSCEKRAKVLNEGKAYCINHYKESI